MSEAACDFVLKAHEASLRVTLHLTEAGLGDQAEDWVSATVEARAGNFSGRFDALLWINQLYSLLHTLQALHERVSEIEPAFFQTLEGDIRMAFVPTRLGHLQVEVEVTPDPATGPYLRFTLDADQSFLPEWIASLDAVLAATVRQAGGQR
jgi:hypothetical protein